MHFTGMIIKSFEMFTEKYEKYLLILVNFCDMARVKYERAI
jgi:hypothetical protein